MRRYLDSRPFSRNMSSQKHFRDPGSVEFPRSFLKGHFLRLAAGYKPLKVLDISTLHELNLPFVFLIV